MISNNIHKTAQMPSFGVSAYGQTSVKAATVPVIAGTQVWTCARTRFVGDMGLATKDSFPGTRAWRPTSC